MDSGTSHIRILAGFELRQMLRGAPGILAGLFLLFPLAWLLSKVAGNADIINNLAAGNLTQEETFVLAAVKWLADLDEAVLERLLVQRSPFVSMVFVMTAFAMPLLTMIATLDQNATDIGSKGIRFYLPRTGRRDLLLGRLLGTLAFWALLIALAGVAVTIVALVCDETHGPAAVLLDGLWFTGALVVIAVPFAAFMALCAVVTGNPLLSITMGLGAYLGIFLLGGLGGMFHEALKVIRYAFPSPLRYDLMLGSGGELVVALVASLAYSAVYLAAAGWVLGKRDL
jgi:hypothetical protein